MFVKYKFHQKSNRIFVQNDYCNLKKYVVYYRYRNRKAVHKMTNEQVQATYKQALTMVEQAGYTPINLARAVGYNRRKKAYAVCKTSRNIYTGYCANSIMVSKYYAEKAQQQDMLNALVHEILHACYPTDGHTGKWKQAAKRLNTLYNLDIQRCNDYKDENGEIILKSESVAKYTLKCPACGELFYYNRMCKVVKYPSNYQHTPCKCDLIRIK